HPAVWWVSSRIRSERENCCDDLAIHACGGRTTYAHALAALAELSVAWQPKGISRLVAAKRLMPGAGVKLLARVRRIIGLPDSGSAPRWMAGVLVVASLIASGLIIYGSTASGQAPQAATPPATQPAETIPLGQVIERTIGDVDEGERDHLIDFETGKLFALPGGFGGWPAPRRTEWMTQDGRDALVDGAGDGWVIGGYDFQAASMGAAKWEAIRPEDVRARLRAGEPGVKTLTRGRRKSYAVGRPWSPGSILAFKTRDGGIGVLQC
ncbi:unnamed protein product, partial [marine sediment metagenome]